MKAPPSRAWLGRAALVGAWITVALIHLSGSAEARLHSWPLGYLSLEALACASLAHRAWNSRGQSRAAWWLLAASVFLEVPNIAIGLLQSHGQLARLQLPLSSILSLATGGLVLMGVLGFPLRPEEGRARRRRALDSLIFAASVLFLLWVAGVQGSLRSAGQGVGLRVFVAYLNVALLGGGLVFMTSYHPERIRGPLGWLGLSAAAWATALTCWTLAGLPGTVATEDWIFVAGAIPLFQGLAAWSPRSMEETLGEPETEFRFSELLPYLPVIVAIIALGLLLVWAPSQVTRETVAIALAIVALLLARQFLAIKDLQTARRTLEERVLERTRSMEKIQTVMLRTERMNSLATLGAGLAHDLNNYLGVIKNSAELMSMELDEGQSIARCDLSRIIEASAKAGSLSQRLMTFARREVGSPDSLSMDLAEAIASTQEILRMMLPRRIQLNLHLGEAPPGVLVDPTLVEQVLVNLVSNAKDAMPDGGEVTIRLRNGIDPDGLPAAMLEVSDTGHGIPPEIRETVFDPFFTTKPEGKGTGLGLASVRTLIEGQGGTVEIHCPPGQGTAFRLSFPHRT